MSDTNNKTDTKEIVSEPGNSGKRPNLSSNQPGESQNAKRIQKTGRSCPACGLG